MPADGSRLGWSKARRVKADGQQVLLYAAWVSCGESLLGGLVSRLGGCTCYESTFPRHFHWAGVPGEKAAWELFHIVRVVLTGGAGHPARHGWWCQSPATVPVAEASGRALGRETLCCQLETGYFYWNRHLEWRFPYQNTVMPPNKSARRVCRSRQLHRLRAPHQASGLLSGKAAEAQELTYFFFLAASKVTLMFLKLKEIECRRWESSSKQILTWTS